MTLLGDQPNGLTFQRTQFDSRLPRYKSGANRLGKLRLQEMDQGAFFARFREALRLELIRILEEQ